MNLGYFDVFLTLTSKTTHSTLYIAPQQPIPRYFTIQLINSRFLCNLKRKIQLHNQGGIGLPSDAMKFIETEDASISLGPGLSVSKYTGRKEKFSSALDCKRGL